MKVNVGLSEPVFYLPLIHSVTHFLPEFLADSTHFLPEFCTKVHIFFGNARDFAEKTGSILRRMLI